MRLLFFKGLVFFISCCMGAKVTYAQKNLQDIFASDEVLNLQLSGNIRPLLNDRSDDAAYHPVRLSYKDMDSNLVTIPLKAKTRGNFRRSSGNCLYPPILLNFQKNVTGGTLFKNLDKVKLVMPCQGDQYIIREYLVYKLYGLLTPKSFKARLVKLTLHDTIRKKQNTFYSILLEEDEQMAKRNSQNILERKRLTGENTETETFLKMAVFQYMIGNTDWSVPFLHNIRILAYDSLSIPSVVPYDFDHAGIVNAPYALPPEQLELRSTQDRLFRGYCITDMKTLEAVLATYNRLKAQIYDVYTSCPLLDKRYINSTLRFLDAFYATINDPAKAKDVFTKPCHKPNIVIKGLKKD